jgi:hypothetical protein
MKFSKFHTMCIGFLLLAFAAQAQSVPSATITFTAPTTFTDGTPIPAGTVMTYGVYQGAPGATKIKVATITATSTTITTGLVGGATYCFTVTAIIAGVGSPQSNEGCKVMALPIPSAVVITVT